MALQGNMQDLHAFFPEYGRWKVHSYLTHLIPEFAGCALPLRLFSQLSVLAPDRGVFLLIFGVVASDLSLQFLHVVLQATDRGIEAFGMLTLV